MDSEWCHIKAYPRAMFFAPYKSWEPKYGYSPGYIGNMAFCETLEGANKARSYGIPVIVPPGIYAEELNNMCFAFYAHAGGNNLENGRAEYEQALAIRPEKPVILYLDGRDWPVQLPTWIDMNRTWLSVQMYLGVGESYVSFTEAMSRMIIHVDNFKLPLVATSMAYDLTGAVPIEKVIEIQWVIDAYLRSFMFIGEMPFSEMRPGGFNFYPELKEILQRRFDAIPNRPNRYNYWRVSGGLDYRKNILQQLNYTTSTFLDKDLQYLRMLVKDNIKYVYGVDV